MTPDPKTSDKTKSAEPIPGGSAGPTTVLTCVDGATGRIGIRGFDLTELAEKCGYEEVAFLLWRGYLPKANELRRLKADLAEARRLPQPLLDLLATFPRDAHPVTVLRTAVSALGVFDLDAESDNEQDSQAKSRHVTAQLPTVAAAWMCIREGRPQSEPQAKATLAAGFLQMLRGSEPSAQEAQLLDKIFVVLADHGVDTPAAAARLVAATRGDIYSALGAAIGALQGSLHGGATQGVMESLQRIGTRKKVATQLERWLQKKQRLAGFGHAVHKRGDPRAVLLKPIAQELGALAKETLWYEVATDLEAAVAVAVPGLAPNVDFYLAPALYSLGIAPEFFSTVFACARSAGLCAHVMEQRGQEAWGISATWSGSAPKPWKPLAER